MENLFKIGCNFDFDLINIVKDLNDQYKGKGCVKEFFGSDAIHHHVTARPQWRLTDISIPDLEKYVQKSLDAGIYFNYTMNSISPYASKVECMKHEKELKDWVKALENMGVYRITVANPMLAMMIREVSNIELELSTISHLDTVTQLKYYHEQLGINKFCGSILKNRNKKFLKNCADYCNANNLIYEVLANESCGVAGDGYATHCIYRDSCYICHATCVTKEDSMLYKNYPMNFCMSSRKNNEEAWIKMRMIRPEDLKFYNDIGINYFKVSGRTGSTEYLKTVLEAYLKQDYHGNFLALWKPLETIYNQKKESEHKFRDYIDNKKLDGFLNHWFDGDGFSCENEMCGTTCHYCRDFYQKHKLGEPSVK